MSTAAIDLEQLADLIAERLAPPLPRLVAVDDAAELLGVPPSWLASEARAGRAPHRKLGKYVRFEPTEIRAWADDHAHGQRPRRATA